jgi:hypothetical protein
MDARPLLGLVLLAATGGCRREARCDWATQPGPWAFKANWTACTDAPPRSVECVRGESTFKCTCIVGGAGAADAAGGAQIVASFVLPSLTSLSDREQATRTANELCHWNLAP